MFGDTKREDPIAEALSIPLKAVFQDEKVSDLMRDVLDLNTNEMEKWEKSSFLEKIGFYSRARLWP